MDRTERFYRIDQMLSERRCVPFRELQDALEVSRATLKRDLEYLRNRFNAPIVFDRDLGGYRFDERRVEAGGQYELPGLWFNASEAHALLAMQHLLSHLQPGILTPHVAPLQARLRALLGGTDHSLEELEKRVRILGMGARVMDVGHFEVVGSALLRRRRMVIRYHARSKDEETEREISPQRLVHYRDNWYLDAWCHLREGLRSFAVDSIRSATLVNRPARNVAESTLDAALGAGYGIFAGARTRRARLRFNAEHARWVSEESWHPRQQGSFQDDGGYVLEIPYSDPRELIMDVMRHGAGVEVLAPATLREAVRKELAAALQRYKS